jgi:hypothetical protein
MFGSPLFVENLRQQLEVLDTDGQRVAGRLVLIGEPETGEVYGMRYIPNAPLAVGKEYEVILKAGTLTADFERGTYADYRWTFTVIDPASAGADVQVPPEPVGALPPPAEGGIPGQLPGMPTPNDGTRIFLPLLRR